MTRSSAHIYAVAAGLLLLAAGCTKSKKATETTTAPAAEEKPAGATASEEKAAASAAKPAAGEATPAAGQPAAEGAGDGLTGKKVKLVTNMGEIVIELYPDKAPKSVANFLRYVREGHYAGTIFHRVIDGFMIQGGGFTRDYQEKPTHEPVQNEADNGLKNLTGTVAMARTPNPHSATAQFFINVADNAFLDFREKTMRGWGYTVFGKVVEGMDVVNKIKAVKTGQGGHFSKDVPQTPVVIEKAVVVE